MYYVQQLHERVEQVLLSIHEELGSHLLEKILTLAVGDAGETANERRFRPPTAPQQPRRRCLGSTPPPCPTQGDDVRLESEDTHLLGLHVRGLHG